MGPLIGGGLATLLFILVLSRVVGNNPLYRLAQHLLIGVSLGYIGAVLVRQSLIPPITQAAIGAASIDTLIVLAISGVLAMLIVPRFGRQRWSHLANLPLALLFGVGAAIALVGAARGTIIPQVLDTIAVRRIIATDIGSAAGILTLLITTIVTLLSFRFVQRGEQPSGAQRGLRALGRTLILAAFGMFFAATVTTYITVLVSQLQQIADWLTLLLNG